MKPGALTTAENGTDAARNEPRRAVPLGKNAYFEASTNPPTTYANAPASTVRGWFLRSVGREKLWKSGLGIRLRSCGVRISRGERGVTVYRRPDRAYGRVGGVCICGQSIVCPVCAPRIAAFRAAEIATAFERARNAGYEATLDTYTIPHWAGSPLGVEIDTFGRAWRNFSTGCHGKAARFGYLGNHTSREMTHGGHGWNYHHHQLRYHKPNTHDADTLRASWLACLQDVDRLTEGAAEHAFCSEPVRDDNGAKYCAKLAISVEAQSRALGLELTGATRKGRNIVSLLADFVAGDALAGERWTEGVTAVCVRRKLSSVRWSPKLRESLGMAEHEKTDEEVAVDERLPTDELLGELTALQWRAILIKRCEYALCNAAQQGVEAVNTLLANIEVGPIHTDGLPEPHRETSGE